MNEYVPSNECSKRILSMVLALLVFFFSFLAIAFELTAETSYYTSIVSKLLYGSFFIVIVASYAVGPFLFRKNRALIEVPEHLELGQLIRECSRKMSLKTIPECFFSDSPMDTCFVFGRTNRHASFVIGRSFYYAMSENELRPILLHEIAHLKNRDVAFMTWSVALTFSLKYWFLFMLATMGVTALFLRDSLNEILPQAGLIGPILLLLTFWILPALIFNSISRTREYLADAQALILLGHTRPMRAAIKEAARFLIFQMIAFGETQKRFRDKALRFLTSRIPILLSKHTIMTHPTLEQRIEAIEKKLFIVNELKPYVPTYESAAFSGLISYITLYGLMGIIVFLAATSIPALLEYPALDLLLFQPGIVVALLNISGYSRGQRMYKAWLKSMVKRNVVSSVSYTLVLLTIFWPNILVSLPVFLWGLFMNFSLCFLVSTFVLYLLAILALRGRKSHTR